MKWWLKTSVCNGRVTLLWWSSTAAGCNGPAVELTMQVLDGFLIQLFHIYLCAFFHMQCVGTFQMCYEFALAGSPKKQQKWICTARPFSSCSVSVLLFWLIQHFKNALKVLLINFVLNLLVLCWRLAVSRTWVAYEAAEVPYKESDSLLLLEIIILAGDGRNALPHVLLPVLPFFLRKPQRRVNKWVLGVWLRHNEQKSLGKWWKWWWSFPVQ